MQINFFGTHEDHLWLCDLMLAMPSMRLFERYSRPDSDLREFRSLEEINDEEAQTLLSGWLEAASGPPQVEYFPFTANEAARQGGAGRHALRGSALIWVHLQRPRNGRLNNSSLSCWSERDLRRRGASAQELAGANWPVIEAAVRKLQRQLMKLAPAKLANAPVLPNAYRLLQTGRLRLWAWGQDASIGSPARTP